MSDMDGQVVFKKKRERSNKRIRVIEKEGIEGEGEEIVLK